MFDNIGTLYFYANKGTEYDLVEQVRWQRITLERRSQQRFVGWRGYLLAVAHGGFSQGI